MEKTKYPVIDCHCHIYPDAIAPRAVAGVSSFYGINMGLDGTVATLVSEHESAGIIRALVHSVATTPHQVSSINHFIANAVAQSCGRFIGFGTLHPDSDDIARDIDELVSLGLHGVKLHPDIQGFKIDDYRCLKIYELCEGRLPILFHLGDNRYDFSNPNRIKPILDIFTGLTVIGAHFGGWSIWERASEELCGCKNLFVDCSSSLYALSREQAVGIIRRYGAQRVLFGSDYPMWSPKEELERFLSLELEDGENKMILYENARGLLQILD